jgi:hypothetical protein
MWEPMFVGYAHPKKVVKLFEYLPVLQYFPDPLRIVTRPSFEV